MRSRSRVVAVGCVALCAAPALALLWTWIGAGADHHWDTCPNWDLYVLDPEPCWPSSRNDSARIPPPPVPQDPWLIDLIEVTIGETTIEESVNFGWAHEQGAKLHTWPLTFHAVQGEITLLIADAEIRTW